MEAEPNRPTTTNSGLNKPLGVIAAGAFVMMMSYVFWVGRVGARVHERDPAAVERMQLDATLAYAGIWLGAAVFLVGVILAVVRLVRNRPSQMHG